MENTFNYIVPIFNKEDILPKTLESIESCAGSNSRIVLVVDGCTDRSEAIVDEFIKNSSHETTKIIMPNVHMLLSVNAGLKTVKSGFSIIMQDDIILKDFDTENKLIDQYKKMNGKLGVVSFRYGSNIGFASFLDRVKSRTLDGMIEEIDLIQGPDDHGDYPTGDYNKFYPRMSAINGPNCIPFSVLSKIGILDHNLAPYGFDDPEYCLRALKVGFTNGLFPLQYQSDEDWGGTRRSKSFYREAARIHKRNKIYVYRKHYLFIKEYLRSNKIYRNLESI
jgi:glycosyltransferase involved in cell wall biosynthesis